MEQKKTVYFNLRKSSRERMWDTAREAGRVCEAILPEIQQQTSIERLKSYKNVNNAFLIKLKHLFKSIVPLINYQTVDYRSNQADILYMWGAFPKNSTKPFIVELDNPYVLTYYNQCALGFRRNSLKKKLRQAEAITFLSETAKNHFIHIFGQEFTSKCYVLPPFMKSNYQLNKRTDDGIVRFLFVGLGFRRKGGPELLEAFSQLKNENARLTIVSPVPELTKEKYSADKRITFLPPQPRSILMKEIYATHDIFIFPSLLETLGVVILEALSFGMGIIVTNSYATPEMVKDSNNGIVVKHPFQRPVNLNGQMVIDVVTPSREKFQKKFLNDKVFYQEMSDEVMSAMESAMRSYNLWHKHSQELFISKYLESEWERKFSKIIK